MTGVNYDVNATLRTSGSFAREASLAATAGDALGSSWARMGDKIVGAGERVRGTFMETSAMLGSLGAKVVGGGLVTGLGMATAKGVEFNNTMEQGALGLATMYQMFGVAEGLEKNVQLAQAFQKELVAIADASPGTTQDMITAYQSAAPAMSSVTKDLLRQRDIMENLATLAWTNDMGSYQQMGADFGRIIKGGAGTDVSMFMRLSEPIAKAFEEVTGQQAKTGEAFTQQFNDMAKASGETALQIMEKVIGSVPPEFNAAFGQSFDGVMASVESTLLKLAGDFSKPLYDAMRDVMVYDLMGDGPLSDQAFGKLREAAFFAGGALADLFEEAASRLIETVDYVANNWQSIAATIQEAGVAAGKAIQVAITVGIARHVIGSSIIAAGKIAAAFDGAKGAFSTIGDFLGKQIRQTHMGLARGMKGKGAGITGAMGRGLGGVFGKLDGSKGPLNIFRGMDAGILKITSLVTVVGSLGAVATMGALALGGIAVAIGGVAAWFVSKWDEISGALVTGLENGSISLLPLITSLYTFYLRLQLVGEALMGTTTAADIAGGGISFLTTAVDVATATLSPFIYALGVMVGAWGILKTTLLGVMTVILGFVKLGNTIGAISDATLARAQAYHAEFANSTRDTFQKSQDLFKAAGAIADAQLSPLDYEKAKARAGELERGLIDAIKGTGAGGPGGDGKGGGRAKKPAVKIDKVVVEVKLDDPDPDRLFASFLPKMVKLADARTQAYDTLDAGS